jgi:hypothetical protein
MNPDHVAELKNNEITRKRLAKWMAQFCFRNTKLEDFHNRFSDDDMKELMIDCVDHCYLFLSILFTTENSNKIIDILAQEDRVPDWKEPEISDEVVESAKKALALLEQAGVVGRQ